MALSRPEVGSSRNNKWGNDTISTAIDNLFNCPPNSNNIRYHHRQIHRYIDR
jgi:hypothetical protein